MADVFKAVLDISLAASALALIALAARLVIGRRPGAALPLLSALVILRLAIPVTIPSQLSVMNLFQDISIGQPAEVSYMNETPGYEATQPTVNTGVNIAAADTAEDIAAEGKPEAADPAANAGGSYPAADEPAIKALPAMETASIIWIAGIAAMAACIIASNIRFARTLKKNRKYDAPGFSGLLERCKEELGIKRSVEAVQLSNINTAAVYGILRPKLLISPSFGWLSDEEKRHVLLHELSHIKRRDTLVCLLAAALNVVYWFNPIVWLALSLARRDMEIMCDMSVLRLTGDKRAYASTLYSLARASNTVKPKLVSALFIGPQNALRFGVLVSTDSIKRRMKMITRYKRSRLYTAVSIILVIAIAITGCTGAVSGTNAPDETISKLLEIEGQELIAYYSLDFSSIADDEARVANIKKAAEMLDGTVLMNKSDFISSVENMKRFIEIPNVFTPITEEAGWRNAAWTGWNSVEKYIHEDNAMNGYFAAVQDKTAETKMEIGGGLEIAAMAFTKAAERAELVLHVFPAGLDSRGFYDPENDTVNNGGIEVVNNQYESDLILRMRVKDNCVIAAFYTPPEITMKFSIPEIEGQKFIASYCLDISSLAGDEARIANIKKAADMLDDTVFLHRDASLSEAENNKRGVFTRYMPWDITEEAGWQNAAWTGWKSVDAYIYENITSGYFAPVQDPRAETGTQVGGGLEIATIVYYKAAKLTGLAPDFWQDPAEDNIYSGVVEVFNNKYGDLVLKMWVEDDCVIAAFYAQGTAEFSPALTDQVLVSRFVVDYNAFADDMALMANIERAAVNLDGTVLPRWDADNEDMDFLIELTAKLAATENIEWKMAPFLGWDAVSQQLGPNNDIIVDDYKEYKISADLIPGNASAQIGGGKELVLAAVYNAARYAYIDETVSWSVENDISSGWVFMSSHYTENVTIKVRTENNMIVAEIYVPEGTEKAVIPPYEEEESAPVPVDWRKKFPSKFSTRGVEQTENSYRDGNISVTIEKVQKDGAAYFVADIYVADLKYFRTAFPGDADTMGGRDFTDKVAEEVGAILAINGDHCLDNPGPVVRNGQLYRDKKASLDVLVMNYDGSMQTYSPGEFDMDKIKTEGAYQVWAFGPMLLKDGQPMTGFNSNVESKNPRTAVGYYEPGHYCFVVVDGRQPGYSDGMTLKQLSQLFAGLGCAAAYNMDGGRSAEMVFMGELVNHQMDGRRSTTDILYIGE